MASYSKNLENTRINYFWTLQHSNAISSDRKVDYFHSSFHFPSPFFLLPSSFPSFLSSFLFHTLLLEEGQYKVIMNEHYLTRVSNLSITQSPMAVSLALWAASHHLTKHQLNRKPKQSKIKPSTRLRER